MKALQKVRSRAALSNDMSSLAGFLIRPEYAFFGTAADKVCNHRLIWSTNQSGLEGLRRGFKHIGSP